MREVQNNEPVVIQDIVVDPLFPRDVALLMRNPSSYMGDINFPVYPFLRNPSSSLSTGYDHPLYKQVPSYEGSAMTGLPTAGLSLLREGSDVYIPGTDQPNSLSYSSLPYISLDRQNSIPLDSTDLQRKRSSSVQVAASTAVPKFVRQNTDMQYPSSQSSQSNQYQELNAIPLPINDRSNEISQSIQNYDMTNSLKVGEESVSSVNHQLPNQHSPGESMLEDRREGDGDGHLYLTASVNGVDYHSEM